MLNMHYKSEPACFSSCFMFSMWFVQNVGAPSHAEVVVNLSKPPAKKIIIFKTGLFVFFFEFSVPHQRSIASERAKLDLLKRGLKTKNVESLLLRNGWKTCNANKHMIKVSCWWLIYLLVYSLFTFLHPECCTGNSNRTPTTRFHTKSCTAVGWCSTWQREQKNNSTLWTLKPWPCSGANLHR